MSPTISGLLLALACAVAAVLIICFAIAAVVMTARWLGL